VAKEGKYPGYPSKIVTEVKELDEFYVAEEYHQNYYKDADFFVIFAWRVILFSD